MEDSYWRKCSSCKKPIGYNQPYQRCSVTTCNQLRTSLVFCCVSCWSAHVPVVRHRDAWALEETSPSKEQWAKMQAHEKFEEPSATPVKAPLLVRAPVSNAPALKSVVNDEVLVVVSKLKAYIKDRSDMNTSADVMDVLSSKLRKLCDDAIASATRDGRKTVMARDF